MLNSVLLKKKYLSLSKLFIDDTVFVCSKMNLFDSNLICQNKNNLKSLFFKLNL